jgi:tetratricopeptide (TPR) repeat protein
MVSVLKTKKEVRKTALMIGAESNLHLIIKNLVKTYGWNIDVPSCSPQQGLRYLHNTKANALIIVDSPAFPAAESIRYLRRDLLAIVTPTMCILGDVGKVERELYAQIHRLQVAAKPITTSNFFPIFNQMIKVWEQPALRALQQCVSRLTKDNLEVTIQILTKLLQVPETTPFACMSLSLLHCKAGNYLAAESMLIAALKNSPSNVAVWAICAWFYMDVKIPAQALLFLGKLKQFAPSATLLNLDIASASIAAGKCDDALIALIDWNHANSGNDAVPNFIARLALATGRQSSLSSEEVSSVLVRKVSEQWTLTLSQATPKPIKSGATARSQVPEGTFAASQAQNPSPRKNAS